MESAYTAATPHSSNSYNGHFITKGTYAGESNFFEVQNYIFFHPNFHYKSVVLPTLYNIATLFF